MIGVWWLCGAPLAAGFAVCASKFGFGSWFRGRVLMGAGAWRDDWVVDG